MGGTGPLTAHIERRRGKWQIVVELGEQVFRQCEVCRDLPRADGRPKGSPRWWLADGGAPNRCPDCDAPMIEDTGRRQRRVGGFDRKKDAEAELQRVVAAHRSGRDVLSGETTVAEWFEKWLDIVAESVRSGDLAPRTAVGYESHVRIHLQPKLGHLELRQVTPGHVADLMRGLRASGRSATTARNVRTTLSRALSDAMRHELVHRNVAQIAKPPRVDSPPPSAFSREEFDRIAEAARAHRLGLLFLFAACTGLRASELRGLRWSDIDLDAGTYQVRKGLHRITESARRVVEPGLVESRPKNQHGGQVVPLSQTAVRLLRAQLSRQEAERQASIVPWPADDHVFTSEVGTPLEPSNVRRVWVRLLEDANVPAKTPDGRGRGLHELRRTFATRLRDRGIPLEDVQRLGRWSSPQVLLKMYASTDEARLRQAAEAAADGLATEDIDPTDPA